MTTDELRHLATEATERANAATKGPWYHLKCTNGKRMSGVLSVNDDEYDADDEKGSRQYEIESALASVGLVPNANFIAHARTDVPMLAAAALELIAERDAALADVATLRNAIDLVYKKVKYDYMPGDVYAALTAIVQDDAAWPIQEGV